MSTESDRFVRIRDFIKRIQARLASITYLNTTLRAIFAVALGFALVVHPEKTRPLLVNFMGAFWLAGGFLSLKLSGKNHRRRWLGLIVGIVSVIAGLVVVGRRFTYNYLDEMVIVNLLAVLMILTGMIHIGGGPVDQGEDEQRRRRSASILGIIEIVLGILLLIAQDINFSATIYYLGTLWAFVGGIILFGDALRQRRQAMEKEQQKLDAPVAE